jgi:hypothetical protein
MRGFTPKLRPLLAGGLECLSEEPSMAKPSEEQIRERAHQLWEAAGKPEGREHDFWYQAERELTGNATTNPDEKSKTFLE